MWKEVLLNYGIFLLELLTLFGIVAMIILLILSQRKSNEGGSISLTNLSEQYEEESKSLHQAFLNEAELKQQEKADKAAEKARRKAEKARLKSDNSAPSTSRKSRLFVLTFHGDLHASQVNRLRREVDAVLTLADPSCDKVLLKLESPGGVVHGYGLAASQLQRLKARQLHLTVAVDKVAASGGYMMACIADQIVSAPFAVIGSIGVVAEIPNIHRLLKKHDIDVDVMTAGEYKRTVTLMGENTEQGKAKFQQELNETHALFKQFVATHRPHMAIEQVATGEHWFGQQALALQLVDAIATSDDLILQACQTQEVIEVVYHLKKPWAQRVSEQMENSVARLLSSWLLKRQSPLL